MPNEHEIRASRAAKAVHLAYVEGLTQQEIADRIGVTQAAVSKYLNEEPGKAVKDELYQQATHTRLLAWEALVRQLRVATDRAANAETLTKDYGETEDDIEITEETNDDGQVIKRIAVPKRYLYDDDHEAQADARAEVREILKQMRTITGASDIEIEISTDDDSTGVDITTSVYAEDDTE